MMGVTRTRRSRPAASPVAGFASQSISTHRSQSTTLKGPLPEKVRSSVGRSDPLDQAPLPVQFVKTA